MTCAVRSGTLLGVEYGVDRNRKAVEQSRMGHLATVEDSIFRVRTTRQLEHGDRFVQRIDDPILGDARLGIIGPLHDGVAHEDKIWFPLFARTNLEAKWRDEHLTAHSLQKHPQHFVEKQ